MPRTPRSHIGAGDNTIEFPFRLNTTVDEFVLADDLRILRMDEAARKRLLKIEDVEYDERGLLKSFVALPGCLLDDVATPDLDVNDQFCSSNYVFMAPSRERAIDFNLALKLYRTSVSSLYIGYSTDRSTCFLAPPCYFGTEVLSIDENRLPELSRLTEQVTRSRTEPKFGLMGQMYLYAMSRQPRKEARFVEFAIILEMLLLPTSSSELAYRFALRFAKLLSTHFGYERPDAYALGKAIYTTRSRLVHTGKDDAIDQVAARAFEATRTLLAAYSADKGVFREENLDALCLSG